MSDLRLPSFFSNGAVLQRNRSLPIWGWAKPNSLVTITLDDSQVRVRAKADGSFSGKLPARAEGGPYVLTVSSGADCLTVDDVWVGEVWVCSGQSNMEFSDFDVFSYEEDRKIATPMVRTFTAPKVSTETPQSDVSGAWLAASSDTVGLFSGVAFAFGYALYEKLGVAIGLIHTSWGGTPAESWTSREALLTSPATEQIVTKYLDSLPGIEDRIAEHTGKITAWFKEAFPADADNQGYRNGWAGTDESVDADWGPIPVPGFWETSLKLIFDGHLWYRKTIEVPDSMQGQDLTLHLGAIDDCDITYFNGVEVGSTSIDTDAWSTVSRDYTVRASLVKPGRNVIAVRVFDFGGSGGFASGAFPPALIAPSGESIDLSGEWKYKIEAEMVPPTPEVMAKQPFRPLAPGDAWVPGGLYNAMLAPFIPYAIRGAIWYQGESNADRAYQYRTLFPMMISDWRKRWKQGNFPFYYVQLANFYPRNNEPVESAWAELREAQLLTLKKPNTGMAVIIDIGDAEDIHPRNKRDVGRRLAQWALAKDYGYDIPYSGPLYRSSVREGSSIRIEFDNVFGGLKTSDGGPLVGFSICGKDRRFVWADATIEGDTVVVSSAGVETPVAVRYGWSDNPEVNLTNDTGIPASPFRTDKFKGLTQV